MALGTSSRSGAGPGTRDGRSIRRDPTNPRGRSRGHRVATPGSDFRGDIEGLRALAVGLVLAYHAGLPVVGGGYVGVDVFFVVSGFLITGLVVREIERTGSLDLAAFYARRAPRLSDAAILVHAHTVAPD